MDLSSGCGRGFNLIDQITYYCVVEDLNMLNISLYMYYRRNISVRFSSNPNVLEVPENIMGSLYSHLLPTNTYQ